MSKFVSREPVCDTEERLNKLNQKTEYVGGTEPSFKAVGMLWYNTSTQKLKVWNGAAWVGVVNYEEVETDLLPSTDNTYSLGTASKRWKTLHISESLDVRMTKFRAYNSVEQVFADYGTWYKLAFNTVQYDALSEWHSDDNGLWLTSSGYYLISAGIARDRRSDEYWHHARIAIMKNGIGDSYNWYGMGKRIDHESSYTGYNADFALSISALCSLSAGDKLYVAVRFNSPGVRKVDGGEGNCFFSVVRVF